MIAAKVIGIFISFTFIFPNFLTSILPENGITNYSIGPTYISLNRNKREEPLKNTATRNFIIRHIRKGNCFGIKQEGQNYPISFQKDLFRTAARIGDFKGRHDHTYILSMTRSEEEIGECLGEYVERHLGNDTFVHLDHMTLNYYHTIDLHSLEGVCNSQIYIAHINIHDWSEDLPTIYCKCGHANFKVGFYMKNYHFYVHHFDDKYGWNRETYRFSKCY